MLKKLASIFVETDESSSKAEKAKPQPKAEPKPEVKQEMAPVVLLPGQLDQEMLKILDEAIALKNLPGFDYFEFRDSLAKMQSIPMPEEQKFMAVFATAQTLSPVSKESLISSVSHYIKVVNDKHSEFLSYIESKIKAGITAKEKKTEELNGVVAQKAKQIEELTKEINAIREEQNVLLSDVSKEKLSVQQKIAAFEATKDSLINRLQQDQQKMETYLK